MKTSIICILLLFIQGFGYTQVKPESFLGRLPSPPGNACSTGENSGKSEFVEAVENVDQELTREIQERRDKMEQKYEVNEDKMKQNAMARTGVSPQLMQQMMAIEKASKGATGEQKKAYDAQKKALAGQMMQQSTNISMGEIESMKSMSKEGKTAWAEAYATEKKAEVMADPKAYQDKNAALMKDVKLVQKQKQLADSLGGRQMKYMKQIEELEKDKSGIDIQTKIKMLESEINEMYKRESVPESEIRAKQNAMRELQIQYCSLMTPRYLDIVDGYKSFLMSSLKDYYRLEKLTNQVNAAQTGVEVNMEPGLMGLEQVKSYLQLLSGSYRYNQIRPLSVYVGAE
jgi:hypothetical protein